MKADEPIPVRSIYTRIKKGGYDPVTMHLRLQGRIEKTEETLRLRSTTSNQVFVLTGEKLTDLTAGENVDIQTRLDARKIPDWDEKAIIEVVIDEIYSPGDAE